MATDTPKSDRTFTPSLDAPPTVAVAASMHPAAGACGVPTARVGPGPEALGVERARLEAAGFDGAIGSASVLTSTDGPVLCVTSQNNEDRTWHPAGCSGLGARLLVDLALSFRPPAIA